MSWKPTAKRVLRFLGWTAATLVGLFLLLVGLSSTVVIGGRTKTRIQRTQLDISQLENALKVHYAWTGRYPDTGTGFKALVDLQLIDRAPKDAWGNDYVYELVDGRPVITSLGADGIPGGEGVNADIFNHPAQVSTR